MPRWTVPPQVSYADGVLTVGYEELTWAGLPGQVRVRSMSGPTALLRRAGPAAAAAAARPDGGAR